MRYLFLCLPLLAGCGTTGMDGATIALHATDMRELRDSSAPPIVRIHDRIQARIAGGASKEAAAAEVGLAALVVGQETMLTMPASRPAR